jgi:NAD(P)-dependent dehydrogenase (short-subunit alcohol dehydrogenase family)
MNITFDGQVALVTGAGAGIGESTARAFAAAGATVVLADIDGAAASSVAQALVAQGMRARSNECDVADEAQVQAMIESTVREFGRLDVAFNNAGVQSPLAELADAQGGDFDRVIGVNLRGVWNCMKYELAQMRAQGSGAIVNCSSRGGVVALPGRSIYNASKHGVIGMTKSAALECADKGIRVNAVCPGIIETPMVAKMASKHPEAMRAMLAEQPNKRMGRPDEIASAVLWLCSSEASFVIGHALVVDGGYTAR